MGRDIEDLTAASLSPLFQIEGREKQPYEHGGCITQKGAIHTHLGIPGMDVGKKTCIGDVKNEGVGSVDQWVRTRGGDDFRC